MSLRPYQEDGLRKLGDLIMSGKRRLLLQLPTGGGKTRMFVTLVARYLRKRLDADALVLVHREELLRQARQTLYHTENIIAEPIVAGVKHLPLARCHVGMVETVFNRLKKRSDFFKRTKLLIVDECHLDNFSKTFPFFNDVIVIGVSASPISSNKRKPLKDFYEEIVVCAQIQELIDLGNLVPNITFNAESANREELVIRGDDFNADIMAAVYSVGKHIQNTVKAYEEFGIGKKTLIFNCNKEHSKLVHEAFIESGYNSRHLDSDAPEHIRTATLEWFAKTPDAILNNIGILTTGFDEPSIQTIIVNKATLSLPLWLQMCGRGSRPYLGKTFFTIIDMGRNCYYHGDWNADRDWWEIFHHPEKPIEGGIGAVIACLNCKALIPPSTRICKWCNTEIRKTAEQLYDETNLEFKLFTKKVPISINVNAIIEENILMRSFYSLHQIKHTLVQHYKVDTLTDEIAYEILAIYQEKVEEWCRITKKDYNQFMKEKSGQWLLDELKAVYSWTPPVFELKF